MAITVIRYSQRPELWADTDTVSRAVWPEYNNHGEVLGRYWGRLFEDFPEFQFVLHDDQDGVVAEGHTVPCVWDGTTEGLGDGIDVMIAGAFAARGAGRSPTAVRPSFKDRYPITPIERYVTWTRENGEPFDPWIRVHVRRGAKIVKPIPHSLRISGTVAEWELWTGMQFPDDGLFTFPAGLAPVEIDHGRNVGLYWEPNVWIIHTVQPQATPS